LKTCAVTKSDLKKGCVRVVVETPKGSRAKYKFDEELKMFRMSKVLPFGMSFPYDFGFIPGTKADDGDPMDVLLMMDVATFPGCVVDARIVGIIRAQQTEDGETVRNDRVVAIEENCCQFEDVNELSDLSKRLVSELEAFFVQYNKLAGKRFKLLGYKDTAAAIASIKKASKG
jgi:inorganic pyrophosphatase